jgi:hypothetical protein
VSRDLLDTNEASRREVGAGKGDVMDIGSIGLEVLKVLSPILLAALTAASAKLAQLIRAKVQNEYLKGLLIRLDDAVLTTVKDLEQSMVEQIKAASADGKITDDEKKQIRDAALTAVKSNLGTKGRAEVAKILGLQGGGMDGLLSSKIEAAVHDLHRTAAIPGGAVRGGMPTSLAAA